MSLIDGAREVGERTNDAITERWDHGCHPHQPAFTTTFSALKYTAIGPLVLKLAGCALG